ncbi:tetratricopeptide repeat protein [Flavitalea flava]
MGKNTIKLGVPVLMATLWMGFCFFSSCKRARKNDGTIDLFTGASNSIKIKSANDHFERGLYFANQKNYEDAKDYFNKADGECPNTPVILNALGIVLSRTGDSAKAFLVFQKALRIDSTFIRTYVNYGGCLNEAGKYKTAITIFNLGLNIFPAPLFERRLLYVNLANSYLKLNQNSKALLLLDSAKSGLSKGVLYNKVIAIERSVKSFDISN